MIEKVWILEHREINEGWNGRSDMDTVIIYVASTEEKAIQFIQTPNLADRGWFAVYSENVDSTGMDVGGYPRFFDLKGNELQEQPV